MRFKGDNISTDFYICNSYLEPLNAKQLKSIGMDGVTFHSILHDKDGLPFAYVLRRNGKLGAFTMDGEPFTDFLYDTVDGLGAITRYRNYLIPNSFSVYEFGYTNSDGEKVYDIYDGDDLVATDVNYCSYVTGQKAKNRYLDFYKSRTINGDIISSSTIYDLVTKKEVIKDFEYQIHDICEEYQKIIAGDNVYDFKGNKIISNPDKILNIQFTDIDGIYITCNEIKYGLAIENWKNELEEIIPCKYHEILQVFKDKIVVKNSMNLFHVVHFEMKNGKWFSIQDNYRLPKDLRNLFILEDESEGILKLRNKKKMLLSHYLLPDRNKYECTEIIYEGNGIFKCFKFPDDGTDGEVTYISQGQAVYYSSQRDEGVYIKKNFTNKTIENLHVFDKNGKSLHFFGSGYNTELASYAQEFVGRFANTFSDFMTVKKENKKNIAWHTMSKTYGKMVVNGITGEMEHFNSEPRMIWHDIYQADNHLYYVKDISATKKNKLKYAEVIAVFNDRIVLQIDDDIYISNKDGSSFFHAKDASYFVDRDKCLCTCFNKNSGFVVSNNGVESFMPSKPINGNQIHEGLNGDVLINGVYLSHDTLEKEIKEGIINSDFKALL